MSRVLLAAETPIKNMPTAQRQQPQTQRYQWEQQWLRENRQASAVIDGGARDTSLTGEMSGRKDAQPLVPAHTQPLETPPAPQSRTWTAQPQAFESTEMTMAPAVARAQWMANTAVATSVVEIRETRADVIEASTQARGAPPPELLEKKRFFAWWRSEDTVQVSVRLEQPERDSATLLASLRRWLVNTGLVLSRLTVNGRVQWNGSNNSNKQSNGY